VTLPRQWGIFAHADLNLDLPPTAMFFFFFFFFGGTRF
jgi:hypothetical protein